MNGLELANIAQVISRINYTTASAKFSYAMAKNKKIIMSALSEIKNKEIPLISTPEFDKKRVEILEKFCKKDEKGKPVIEKGNYVLDDEKGFDKEYELLAKEYKDEIAKNEEIRKKNSELYENKDIEIDFHKVNLDHCPQGINVNDMEILDPIIVEKIML